MSKKFIKNIILTSTISLILLGGTGTAWAMWDELEEYDQHRIVRAHILDITNKGEYKLVSRPGKDHFGRPTAPVQTQEFVQHVPIHIGDWIDNWPELTIEKTCSVCKQDIVTTYNNEVLPKRIVIMQERLDALELKNTQNTNTPPVKSLFGNTPNTHPVKSLFGNTPNTHPNS
jgi:hypothetical protein